MQPRLLKNITVKHTTKKVASIMIPKLYIICAIAFIARCPFTKSLPDVPKLMLQLYNNRANEDGTMKAKELEIPRTWRCYLPTGKFQALHANMFFLFRCFRWRVEVPRHLFYYLFATTLYYQDLVKFQFHYLMKLHFIPISSGKFLQFVADQSIVPAEMDECFHVFFLIKSYDFVRYFVAFSITSVFSLDSSFTFSSPYLRFSIIFLLVYRTSYQSPS